MQLLLTISRNDDFVYVIVFINVNFGVVIISR
jgi:hypothetical protein